MPKTRNDDLAEKFQDALMGEITSPEGCDLLRHAYNYEDWPSVNAAESYREAGLMTADKGLVVEMSDGSKVHLTIVAYSPA